MAQQQTFRNALGGFHREDVVRYIEYLNTQHATEVNQLRSELEYLRAQTAQAVGEEEKNTAETDELIAQQAARIRELFDLSKQQESQLAELTAQLADVQTLADAAVREKTRLAADLDLALQQQISYKSRIEEELEAYRRAERIERLARERAEQMYNQANAVLADATAKVDDAAQFISLISERLTADLSELQSAVSGSKQSLSDAAATMCAIRPTAEIK